MWRFRRLGDPYAKSPQFCVDPISAHHGHYLLYLLMALLLFDVLLRRVRIFGYRPLRAA